MALTNKIGVIADSFRVGVREGLSKAKLAGADGVQIYAVSGEMDPANLTSEARKELKDYIASIGLEISALCGDLGGHGFQDKNVNREKNRKKSKRILDLAVELGTNVVTTHIGVVPRDQNDPIYAAMQNACEELASYATGMNAFFCHRNGSRACGAFEIFSRYAGQQRGVGQFRSR